LRLAVGERVHHSRYAGDDAGERKCFRFLGRKLKQHSNTESAPRCSANAPVRDEEARVWVRILLGFRNLTVTLPAGHKVGLIEFTVSFVPITKQHNDTNILHLYVSHNASEAFDLIGL
jgi:hypothetical protein